MITHYSTKGSADHDKIPGGCPSLRATKWPLRDYTIFLHFFLSLNVRLKVPFGRASHSPNQLSPDNCLMLSVLPLLALTLTCPYSCLSGRQDSPLNRNNCWAFKHIYVYMYTDIYRQTFVHLVNIWWQRNDYRKILWRQI